MSPTLADASFPLSGHTGRTFFCGYWADALAGASRAAAATTAAASLNGCCMTLPPDSDENAVIDSSKPDRISQVLGRGDLSTRPIVRGVYAVGEELIARFGADMEREATLLDAIAPRL